jgi:hypothetical protein
MSEQAKWKKRVDVAMQEDGSQWLPVSDCPFGDIDLRQHLGRFRIDSRNDFGKELTMVLSQVAVIRCEHLLYKRELDFIGFSEHFRPLGEAENIPEYTIVFYRENDRIAWFEFQEQ